MTQYVGERKRMSKSSLSFKEKFGYAGDFASCLYFGISAAALGTMLFVTRTWDWINDPIKGIIADRTNTSCLSSC
jgi:GPH family glycoside/pentoside/hexuronide:cation symporter